MSLIRIPGDTRRKPALPRLNRGHPLARGLIHYFPFAENGGDQFIDLVRNEMSTGASIVAANRTVGRYGRQFDGNTSAYVPFTTPLSASPYPFTVAVLARFDTLTDQALFSHSDASVAAHQLMVTLRDQTGWKIQCVARDGTGWDDASTSGTISAGVWYHIVAIWTTDDKREIFVDGGSDYGINTTSAPAAGLDTTEWGRLGDSTPNWQTDAKIAYGAVWDRVLTASEIQQLYAEPYALIAPPRYVPVGTTAAAGGVFTPYYYQQFLQGIAA